MTSARSLRLRSLPATILPSACLALTALGEPLSLLLFDRCIPLRVSVSYSCRHPASSSVTRISRDLTFVESVENAQRERDDRGVLRL